MTQKVLLIAALALGLYMIPSTTSAQSDASDVNVIITNQTTRMELHEMRNDLNAKGIDFRYHPKFNNEMQLESLKVIATNSDGQVRNYTDEELVAGEQLKIVRTTDSEGNVSFCVGICDE